VALIEAVEAAHVNLDRARATAPDEDLARHREETLAGHVVPPIA
jgi:hypothetical protein